MSGILGVDRKLSKEDKGSWLSFLRSLKECGLKGTRLFVGDKCLGLSEAIHEGFSDTKYQRRVVHFYRNVFSATPWARMTEVAAMLKAIHAQETRKPPGRRLRRSSGSFRI